MWFKPVFGLVFVAMVITSGSAAAGHGAVAYDTEARKAGYAWNEDTQQKADDAARRDCGSDKCKARFGIAPGMCAAFASPESGPAWVARSERRYPTPLLPL